MPGLPLQQDASGNLLVGFSGSSGALDAFARLRISQPTTIFDSKQLYDKSPLFWDEAITDVSGNATSTHSTTNSSTTMHVETGDTIVRQTRTHWAYQPGKGQLVLMTGTIEEAGGVAGVVARIGAFTADDGLFFELDGTAMSCNIRKATVDSSVAQADWDDPMDGSGPSGVTLDFSKEQIYFIAFEWLGVGSVTFGFFIDGAPVIAHSVHNANNTTSVYMSTPNNPVRYEISSTSGTGDMEHICSSVISEGGVEETGLLNMVSTGPTHVDADTANAIYAIVGIRLKSTHLDANVLVKGVELLAETNNLFEFFMAVNPTIAGTFTYGALANSSVDFATGASTNTVTADSWSLRFSGAWGASTNQAKGPTGGEVPNALRLGSTIGGTPDEFVLCARPLSAGADIQGIINFRELL